MTKRPTPPKPKSIVEANRALLASIPIHSSGVVRIFAGEEHETCWACGHWFDGDVPDRAHVVAHSNGGSSEPDNFYLLCHWCHCDQPDGQPRIVQDAWLRGHESKTDQINRETKREMAMLRDVADRLNAVDDLEEFGKDWGLLRKWADRAREKYSRAGAKNVRANHRHAVLSGFVEFVTERRTPTPDDPA